MYLAYIYTNISSLAKRNCPYEIRWAIYLLLSSSDRSLFSVEKTLMYLNVKTVSPALCEFIQFNFFSN